MNNEKNRYENGGMNQTKNKTENKTENKADAKSCKNKTSEGKNNKPADKRF